MSAFNKFAAKNPEFANTTYRERLEAVAYDDIFGVLKRGASALWDNRHTLFPQLAPVLDKAVTTAKTAMSLLNQGKQISSELKGAITADHTKVTQRALKLATDHIQDKISAMNG